MRLVQMSGIAKFFVFVYQPRIVPRMIQEHYSSLDCIYFSLHINYFIYLPVYKRLFVTFSIIYALPFAPYQGTLSHV